MKDPMDSGLVRVERTEDGYIVNIKKHDVYFIFAAVDDAEDSLQCQTGCVGLKYDQENGSGHNMQVVAVQVQAIFSTLCTITDLTKEEIIKSTEDLPAPGKKVVGGVEWTDDGTITAEYGNLEENAAEGSEDDTSEWPDAKPTPKERLDELHFDSIENLKRVMPAMEDIFAIAKEARELLESYYPQDAPIPPIMPATPLDIKMATLISSIIDDRRISNIARDIEEGD